jgi:LPXTG-motif cell wall-anchored protein
MGLIPMGQDPLHAYTGHPISYGGAGDYGGLNWAYVAYKRTRCKGYDDHVKKYVSKRSKIKKMKGCSTSNIVSAVSAPFLSPECKKLRADLKWHRSQGKAAWKTCSAYERGEKKGHTQIDTSGGFSNTSSTGAGAIDPFTGLPVDGGMSTVSYEEDDGGSNMGLYIGIIALLGATGGLIWYKKKKAKSKGSKR